MLAQFVVRVYRWSVGHWRPFFIVGVLLGLGLGFARPFKARTPCRSEHLESLTAERLERVRQKPATVRAVYEECRWELIDDLDSPFADLTEDDRQLVFCMIVSYSMAPYGKSNAIALPDMLSSPYLHCGNYPLLLAELHRYFETPQTKPVCLVGWTFGPHGMAYRPDPEPNRSLFLDPTVAMLVRGSFDEVASGRPIERSRLVSFAHRHETAVGRDYMARAFVDGKFRPSHLLYYYENLDHHATRRGNPKDWPTPGAADQRATEVSAANP
jgi:hypothetical protein